MSKISYSDLAAIYRACEAVEYSPRLPDEALWWNDASWGLIDKFNCMFKGKDSESVEQSVLMLLFFATVMQDGGL